jgi:hypothetical protein
MQLGKKGVPSVGLLMTSVFTKLKKQAKEI